MTNNITSKEACILAHKIRKETGCSLAEAFKAAYSNNASTTPKTSWTKDELSQIFSDKTAELLRKGYMIDTEHMDGHQGEICKIRFKKGNSYFQLIMDHSNNYSAFYGERISIRFGKYTEEVYSHSILWVNKFDTLWEVKVAKIADNYYTTEELANEANDKKTKRVLAQAIAPKVELSARVYPAALACVRKQKGYKGTKLSDIVKVTRVNNYNAISGAYLDHHYSVEISKLNKYGHNTCLRINVSDLS